MNSYLTGSVFEEEVCLALNSLRIGKLIIPRPIYSKELGKDTQTDALYITSHCLYAIEIKSARKLSGSIEDNRWWSSGVSNPKMICIMSPYLQNMAHILAMKLFLHKRGYDNVPFQNIIIVRDNAEVKTDCSAVHTINSFTRILAKEFRKNLAKPDIINIDEMCKIFM